MTILRKVLLVLGALGLIVCLGLYFGKTETILVKDVPVKIGKATKYIGQSFFTKYYATEMQVEPTAVTKPNITYLLVLDNGIIKGEYKVSWSQLEIDIHKLKNITRKISQDEYTALDIRPQFKTDIFEVKPQHHISGCLKSPPMGNLARQNGI